MPISKNTPFNVNATHDNSVDATGASDPATKYRLYLNGVNQATWEQDAPVQTGTTPNAITFAFPIGLNKGSYTVEVAAANADGESKSAPMTVVITGKPPRSPQNVTIAVI